MNKGLGAITSFGAFLLAGFLFQGTSTSSPNLENDRTTKSPTKSLTGDGPWRASCKYWAPARSAESPDDKSSDLDLTLHISGKDLDSHIKKAPSPESACGPNDDGWGIPKVDPKDPEHDPEISVIVATVPDPIHSHLALDFDRSIDAILLAAAANHYLTSDYWLPWRSHVNSSTPGESVSTSTPESNDTDSTRERQPGLIILRYAPDDSEWEEKIERKPDTNPHNFAWGNYHHVIYLFLVAETPALGVNGDQLQHAFQYEKSLKNFHGAALSVRAHPRPDKDLDTTPTPASHNSKEQPKKPLLSTTREVTLSVIGPFYSGSASSLHEGIEAATNSLRGRDEVIIPSISGVTSTKVAVHELDPKNEHIYRSFGENVAFEQMTFLQALAATGYDLSRVAVLSEAGTVFGSNSAKSVASLPPELAQKGTVLQLSFPRELSLLRNAESTGSAKPDSTAPPTPYLNLSLKDYTADDTVPRFSTNQSPLSVEAQLMAIAHQLQRNRSQFILISASNVLDDIFLTGFLHRACPDARIVLINGGDLLFERDVDNAPYIGSISISPYLLTSLDFGNHLQWLHSSAPAEAMYNAAAYTFWGKNDLSPLSPPTLAGYRLYPVPNPKPPANYIAPPPEFMQIPLWATVIGADGYYPLGILRWCASDLDAILPIIHLSSPNQPGQECGPDAIFGKLEVKHAWDYVPESISRNSGISPSLLWGIITAFISLACIGHCILFLSADLWSPSTRDLAIDHNDLPYRRAVHLNIGTSVLVSMAFVTAFPMLLVRHFYHIAASGFILSIVALVAAALAFITTYLKTWRYCYHRKQRLYLFFNLVAIAALIGTIWSWVAICASNNRGGDHTYAGLFFSYRCLQPLSGVCPLLPVLLLLLGWYLWAICQTARLRFSDIHRPRIARILRTHSETPYPLFVPDNALERCSRPTDCCLYENITCLLISREVVCRFCTNLKNDGNKFISKSATHLQGHIDIVLGCIYVVLFALCIFASHIRSLDRFFFTPIFAPVLTQLGTSLHVQNVVPAVTSIAKALHVGVPETLTEIITWSHTHFGPNRYEFLITALFFPLIMVALSGWFRVILIWGALSRGLLEPLERSPIRFAFTRFKGGSWMSMLRQKGLHIRWRDMARSTESIRQLVHHKGLDDYPQVKLLLSQQYQVLIFRLRELVDSLQTAGKSIATAVISTPALPAEALEGIDEPILSEEPFPSDRLWDHPEASADLRSIYYIEQAYAECCRILLSGILVPHWEKDRTGLVEECSTPEGSAKPEEQKPTEPTFLHLAEELIVVRYVALIRSVLINIRYLMLFVSAAFVFAIIAWNSYPFQPHAFIDWCFTILLVMLGLGFVWVFAQMHRNAILSRITDTKANELGWEFYLRIITFGAIPVLTWLAYQFPQIGGGLYKVLQPGLQVVK